MKERRSSKRTPTILEGRLQAEADAAPIECTVRNISETGALILTLQPMPLPNAFQLFIPRYNKSFDATLMWSRDKQHGVRFVEESTMAPSGRTGPDIADPRVQALLEETRQHLAQIMDIPSDAICLTLTVTS